jgi:hypothetical protein
MTPAKERKMSGEGLKQMQGEKRADYLNRVRAAQAEARTEYDKLMAAAYPLGKRARSKMRRLAKTDRDLDRIRAADHVDGFDRDDLGESPDF